MENEDIKLYIPSNVKTRLEFFRGFGTKELIITIAIAIALIPIAILFYYIKDKNYLIPVIIEMIGVVTTAITITKDENNLCVVNQIKYMADFTRLQKHYEYEYYDKRRL